MAIQKGIVKTWPTEHWAKLISQLHLHGDLEIILAGGPDDQEIVQTLLSKMPTGKTITSAFGKTKSLADLAALISLSDLLVCVDSAPMHLAVALDKPLVALFGPTDERKLLPASPKFKALRDKPMSEFPRRLEDGLGVRLQPDTVFQSVMDQLQEWTAPESRSRQPR